MGLREIRGAIMRKRLRIGLSLMSLLTHTLREEYLNVFSLWHARLKKDELWSRESIYIRYVLELLDSLGVFNSTD